MKFIRKIPELFPESEVLILTNGRACSLDSVIEQIAPCLTEKFCFAIPVHANTPELHDHITRTPGSFVQTMTGLRKLQNTCSQIEIRIVGHKLNLSQIPETYRMLANSGLRITTINLIAMEMTGCAATHRDILWVDYDVLCRTAQPGIAYAAKHGINMGLYNFPLCTVPKELWSIAKDSITPHKIRYKEECEKCRVRKACGGLFYSTYELGLCQIRPIEDERIC